MNLHKHKHWLCLTAYCRLSSIRRCSFCMTDINASHSVLFMDSLHTFYPPFKLFPHFKYQGFIGKTCTYLFILQIRPTGNSYFRFQKRWGMTITNYCIEISKREKQKFDHFSLKSSRVTQAVAENIQCVIDANFITLELYYNAELGTVRDRNKDTRCIAICIAIGVFKIAICFLAYRCTPTWHDWIIVNLETWVCPICVHKGYISHTMNASSVMPVA